MGGGSGGFGWVGRQAMGVCVGHACVRECGHLCWWVGWSGGWVVLVGERVGGVVGLAGSGGWAGRVGR